MESNKQIGQITHNSKTQRFETTLEVNGKNYTGYISYKLQGDNIVYDHTIVPKELGGRGIGSTLVKHALEFAQAKNKKVVPQCWFVEKYISRHEEYQNLLE